VARANAAALGAQVSFVESDWFAAVGAARFDFIVSNPPYIVDDDPHLAEGDVRFEPRSALASGRSGLDDLTRIAAAAPAFLAPGGWLLMEHGYDQAAAVRALLPRPASLRWSRPATWPASSGSPWAATLRGVDAGARQA
jgi:release factor glutamine methyltransferase